VRSTEEPPTIVRCAIYTRKSTEEGLDQPFNSLEAQRDSAEAYIRSQQQLGWTVMRERYDDGGHTGANLERPALRRLLQDIEAGRVNCVVVQRLDRLSRSLLDFARLMELFEDHGVALVSVTQLLNSATSMGRLTLHLLLSFAQFERELIAERTRDKMEAARRRGKWVGGIPPLGYDAIGGKLAVNAEESRRVQAIFALYVKRRSLSGVLEELCARRWTTKRWRTRNRKEHAGRLFTEGSLRRLLRNAVYMGKIALRNQFYAGEQPAMVEETVWRQASELLDREDRSSARKAGRHARAERAALPRAPRITRLLALAIRFEEMMRSGVVRDYSVLAQLGQVSRSRITQIMNLLHLAPDVQEEILFLAPDEGRCRICERAIRKLATELDWSVQRQQWNDLRTRTLSE
jgi:site-specific DNA recombinase